MNYKELKELLIKANEAYYKNANPILSDYEFDMKMKELEAMEASQGFADDDSPTRKPGSDLSNINNSNSHGRPMLSLENTYNYDDVRKFYDDIMKATNGKATFIVNPKWDGNSGAIRYKNGKSYKALTRGSGEIGEDITMPVNYCNENIWNVNKSFSGEVRGELIITNNGFEELNADGKYQNARNLVAGSLKLLELDKFIPRADKIKFYAYWLEDSKNETYEGDLKELERNNFDVGVYFKCSSYEEVMDAIKKIQEYKYDVAIDGAVIKLNEKKYWNEIGSTAKFPRWAKAYKYKQESIKSKVLDITFSVGRTGKITPVAWFEPKFIDGSEIQKATLNNKEFYASMDVAIGDIVEVQKAAAIIPQIINVERTKNRKVVEFPTVCPCCGFTLRKHNEDQADLFCDNPTCSSRIVDQIINYTHAIECDGFAEIIVNRLHENGYLNSISDLYELKNHIDGIAKLDRLSKNMAEKLCANVEASKSVAFWKVLSGLGIPNVGGKTAKILVKKFKSIDNLMAASLVDLTNVEDIAEITATSIITYFEQNKTLIEALKSHGVNMADNSVATTATTISNLIFCITGALSMKREQYVELIEAAGGKVSSSVSKKTNYLVNNDINSTSTKNQTAKELNIPIINEDELRKMLGL